RSGLTPGPWSATYTVIVSGVVSAAPTVIVLLFGPCRMAFSIRFAMTGEISIRSTSMGGRSWGKLNPDVVSPRPGRQVADHGGDQLGKRATVRRGWRTPAWIRSATMMRALKITADSTADCGLSSFMMFRALSWG